MMISRQSLVYTNACLHLEASQVIQMGMGILGEETLNCPKQRCALNLR